MCRYTNGNRHYPRPVERRARVVLCILLPLAVACAPAEPPESNLPGGEMNFRVTFDPDDFAGHESEHAQGCFGRKDWTALQSRPPIMSTQTAANSTPEQNRTLHQCLLVIRSATVEVVDASMSGAYSSQLTIEYDDE